jgi:catechol 2,3-dioxygenase-like lactoylglutathione lyase family enzyme
LKKIEFRFVYTGIRVSNLQRSVRFYTKVLGMKAYRKGKMPHGGRYVGLKSPKSEVELELNWYPRTSRFYTPFNKRETLDHLAFTLGPGNEREGYRRLVKAGAKGAVSPDHAEDTDPYVMDPDGNWIELLEWD